MRPPGAAPRKAGSRTKEPQPRCRAPLLRFRARRNVLPNKDLAERTGFEPADQFPGHRFSKPALSTTQPPLQKPYAATACVFSWHRLYFSVTTVYTT